MIDALGQPVAPRARTVTRRLSPPLPDSASALERRFAYHWRAHGSAPYEHEYRFAAHAVGGPGRGVRSRLNAAGYKDWRFDFAWPGERVAVELEGGTYMRGRHTRGAGYAEDCRKYNAALVLGWRVLRYTADMLDADPVGVVEQVRALLSASVVRRVA